MGREMASSVHMDNILSCNFNHRHHFLNVDTGTMYWDVFIILSFIVK